MFKLYKLVFGQNALWPFADILLASAVVLIYYEIVKRDVGLFKPIEELSNTDDFMFSAVMRQEKLCKPLLETILKAKIRKILYVIPLGLGSKHRARG